MITENIATDGLNIALSLDWPESDIKLRRIENNNAIVDIARTSISGQPAATFAKVVDSNGYDPLYIAALYGYHASTDWGLLADDDGVSVFNSHRLVNDDWFQFPKIGWEDLGKNHKVLNALTPMGVTSESIEVLAAQLQEPTTILKPIDDGLVDRLDAWRDQALRYTLKTKGIDEKLQTVYSQLFVLRAVEDRKLDPEIPSLESVLRGSGDINNAAWSRLFKSAKTRIGSELFYTNFAKDIPPHVFAGIIQDLYYPTGLPGKQPRYDFSWIDSDVLGSAYEKYLSTILMTGPRASQLEIFSKPQHEVERFSVRKRSGTYYTPPFLHDYLSKKCVDLYFDKNQDESIPRVVDFACGSGSFLVSAVDRMLNQLNEQNSNVQWAKEIIKGRFISGIDIDPKAVTIARLRLWHRLVEEPDALPLPDLSDVVIVGDGLDRNTWHGLDVEYDIVLGNPPFLKTSMIDAKEELATRFKSAKGRFDFSHLFLEQALDILKPNGYYGLVIPNRILKNKSAELLRKIVINNSSIISIVDFGSNQPFKEVGAYVACLVGEMREKNEKIPKFLRYSEIESLDSNFLTSLLLEAEKTGTGVTGYIDTYPARHPANERWSLLSEKDEKLRIALDSASVRLDSMFGIYQGIKTGANDVFIFELVASDRAHLSNVINGFGESVVVETDLLRSVVYGAEVHRNEILNPSKLLLYPYANGESISEQVLEKNYPNTWRYLLDHRELLASRASVPRGGNWYELSRPRNEKWLRSPKVMMRDLAPRPSFGIDVPGNVSLVGGVAVVPADPEMLYPLLAYLNSSVIEKLVRKTTPQFNSNFRKFEPQHLHSLPVFTELFEDEDVRDSLIENVVNLLECTASQDVKLAVDLESNIETIIVGVIRSLGIDI